MPARQIRFGSTKSERHLDLFLKQNENRALQTVLDQTAERIDGFESPLGMELLATVDWLIEREHCGRSVREIRDGLAHWPAGASAAERKQRLFNGRP